MPHLAFLYYALAYSISLPAAAAVAIAYARTGRRELAAYFPFLASTILQLAAVAALRYEDAALAAAAGALTRRLYFLAESTLIVALPLLSHELTGASRARARNLAFAAASAACAACVFTPLFAVPDAGGGGLLPRAGLYAYRALFFATIAYCLVLLVVACVRPREAGLRPIAASCLASTSFLLWETLHCDLFPVLGHSTFAVALSPIGYFASNLVFIAYALRREALKPASRPEPEDGRAAISGVSAREREIAELVAAGLSNKEIQERLFISDSTVKSHLKSLYRKLGIKNRVQLANLVRRG